MSIASPERSSTSLPSAEREHLRRQRKLRTYLNHIGQPVNVPEEKRLWAVRRIRSFRARGMTFVQMAEQSGVSQQTLCRLARRPYSRMRVYIWEGITRIGFEEPSPAAIVGPHGTRRRLQALWAAGYPMPWISERIGVANRRYVQLVVAGFRGTDGVAYRVAKATRLLYDEYGHRLPEDVGVVPRSAAFARTFAKKKGFAGPGCWDPETIDDPDAHPEWTGMCGTERGYQIHYRERIPYCPPCSRAHREYKLEHPGKSPLKEQRWAEIRRLHHDQGMNVEQIASWLDISERTVTRALKEETA